MADEYESHGLSFDANWYAAYAACPGGCGFDADAFVVNGPYGQIVIEWRCATCRTIVNVEGLDRLEQEIAEAYW